MRFLVTYMASAGITIEANSEDEAKDKFNQIPANLLLDELEENGIEITDCFTEDVE
jgi:hypothetical protein